MLVYSVVLILMMIFRPAGLLGTYEFSLTRTLKRVFGKGEGNKQEKEVSA